MRRAKWHHARELEEKITALIKWQNSLFYTVPIFTLSIVKKELPPIKCEVSNMIRAKIRALKKELGEL